MATSPRPTLFAPPQLKKNCVQAFLLTSCITFSPTLQHTGLLRHHKLLQKDPIVRCYLYSFVYLPFVSGYGPSLLFSSYFCVKSFYLSYLTLIHLPFRSHLHLLLPPTLISLFSPPPPPPQLKPLILQRLSAKPPIQGPGLHKSLKCHRDSRRKIQSSTARIPVASAQPRGATQQLNWVLLRRAGVGHS